MSTDKPNEQGTRSNPSLEQLQENKNTAKNIVKVREIADKLPNKTK